jgi:hypothetical protein
MKIKEIVTAALVLAVMLLAAKVQAGVRENLLQLINAERVSLGKSALTFDSRLDAAAQDHSDDMLAKGFFDHNSQDGRTPGGRIKDEGFYGSWGENIYAHTGTPNAQRVFDGWKNSPGTIAYPWPNGSLAFPAIGDGKPQPGSTLEALLRQVLPSLPRRRYSRFAD